MLGLKKQDGMYIFTAAVKTERLFLNLYEDKRRVKQIPFDPELRIGNVWRLETSEDIGKYSYAYEADGRVFSDPNGTVFTGRKKFGVLKDGTRILKTPIGEAVAVPEESEAWKKDRPLGTPYHESMIYRLHVRGFTESPTSGLDAEVRGTFQGIIDKIPYLKELGITAVELMPPYEFNEVMLPVMASGNPRREELKPTGKINYWGFTRDALEMAPKASFTSDHKNPKNEFRKMVLALHAAGIEVIVDLYFTDAESPNYLSDVMRQWRITYHVDGIHIIGTAPFQVIARDAYLANFKIWADSWGDLRSEMDGHGNPAAGGVSRKYLADYNDGFQNDMRRALKGDENMLSALMYRIRENPGDRAVIHYIANVSGFTLADMVSYDRKHNEENHERNMDGTDNNYSWNCGEEGRSRKKSVNLLRKKMLRNAFVLLLLSQGTPLIQAGDEFGRTKDGNNNSYCQDNRMTWIDWKLKEKNRDLYEFAKYMIHFRMRHGVFHQAAELRNIDYRNTGIPDISFHGENAWQPAMENYRRELGVMYSGAYGQDDTFMVLYNFHWEVHTFGLPHPPEGMKWAIAIDTAAEAVNGIYAEGEEAEIPEREARVQPRSIQVLRAVQDKDYKPKKKRSRHVKSGGTES